MRVTYRMDLLLESSICLITWERNVMKLSFLPQPLAALSLVFLILACAEEKKPEESMLKAPLSATALSRVNVPLRSPQELRGFRVNLALRAVRRNSAGRPQVVRQSFQSDLVASLADAKGVPRAQLKTTLQAMVSPTSNACNDVSCARVFGLSQTDVDQFLNTLHDLVAGSQSFKSQDKAALRDLLLASLGSISADSGRGKPFQERLASLPTMTVPGYARPEASRAALDATAKLADEEVKQIQAYSHIFSTHFRTIEVHDPKNLMNAGYARDAVLDGMRRVRVINRALAKLPAVPGTVFRGMGNLTDDDVKTLFDVKDAKKIIALGQDHMPALTSTSWNPKVADVYSISSRKENYRVIFVIKQRTGRSIETLSRYPAEEEVLLPSNATFQIGQMGYVDRERRLLSVELIETMSL